MAQDYSGIRTRGFGIEIEMTGLTRCQAAQAIAKVLGNEPTHEGGTYDKYTVEDSDHRKWAIVYDSSIRCVDGSGENASKSYSVELNSPVLGYADIPQLQEVIRALRHAGGVCNPEYRCGTHVHISADDFTPRHIRNLVNIFASKEDFLWDALQVSSAREGYCSKVDKNFVGQINKRKPMTMEGIKKLWYNGNMSDEFRHYSDTRYHALNLHSFFQGGHFEIRCCNSSLHAGEVRAQLVLALAIANAAATKKFCSPQVSQSDNMRYSFRVWLLNLGLIGEEFKNCRMHLLKHLTGNIAWRHPEDAIAQRERIKQERIATREQAVTTIPPERAFNEESPNEHAIAAESDCGADYEQNNEETEEIGMLMSM